MSGCMCAECEFAKVLRDNHGDTFFICRCRESEYFAQKIDITEGNCDYGIVVGCLEEAEQETKGE